MAYVELGQDNGGILLNLGEGGFAVQSALAFTSRNFPELRFQVPAVQGWLSAGGRIVWMSDSKKEAGIQFTELPGEARREIQKWVATEDEPATTGGRVSLPLKENPTKRVMDTGNDAESVAFRDNANVAQVERERAPAMRNQAVGEAVAEPAAQSFQFNDYSMFASDPERPAVWSEPPRRRGSWRGTVLGILVAALFFALGVTVGRETVERWIADVGVWTQGQFNPTPKVTPPGPPVQTAVAGAAAATEDRNEANSAAGEDPAKTADTANQNSTSAGESAVGKIPSEDKNNAEASASKTEKPNTDPAVESRSTTTATSKSAVSAARPRHSAETVVPRDNRQMDVSPSRMASEHSILVNAPEPGSPPFFVNLPGEAVSASPAIAISARRTLEILPRSPGSYGRSERVIIGKLISHSEPFYPVEARNQHIEGNVELRARVGRTGQIIGVTPVNGPRLLSSAAMTAVREWRYEPTFIDGDPAETLADITIVFRLP